MPLMPTDAEDIKDEMMRLQKLLNKMIEKDGFSDFSNNTYEISVALDAVINKWYSQKNR
jgi:hypothetical protein